MPVYQAEQRLLRLEHLRNEIDLEIRQIKRDLRIREERARRITTRKPIDTREAEPIAGGVQPRIVRQWALSHGLDVGRRGKVRDEIVALYVEAHQGATA